MRGEEREQRPKLYNLYKNYGRTYLCGTYSF